MQRGKTEDYLEALAARVEAAEAADRELDCRIFAALGPIPFDMCREVVPDFGQWQALRYTASIDAALQLVPEGCALMQDWMRYADTGKVTYEVTVQHIESGTDLGYSEAATPALALCAAALRAQTPSSENPHHD